MVGLANRQAGVPDHLSCLLSRGQRYRQLMLAGAEPTLGDSCGARYLVSCDQIATAPLIGVLTAAERARLLSTRCPASRLDEQTNPRTARARRGPAYIFPLDDVRAWLATLVVRSRQCAGGIYFFLMEATMIRSETTSLYCYYKIDLNRAQASEKFTGETYSEIFAQAEKHCQKLADETQSMVFAHIYDMHFHAYPEPREAA